MPLDCELYAGRGGFRKVQSVVKSKNGDWRSLVLMVFDSPSVVGGYRTRHKSINERMLPAHVFSTRLSTIMSMTWLSTHLAEVKLKCGEGLMIRNPDAHYTPGRTADLLKLK